MSPATPKKADEYQAFLLALQDELGVVVGEERHKHVLEKLKPLMASRDIDSFAELAAAMRDEYGAVLRTSVLEAITAQDSTWLGHGDITRLLNAYVLPGVINQNRSDYRIWLVGCGSGQNAYSLAMTVDAFRRQYELTCSIEIVATDLSENTVQRAARGRYDDAAVTDLPEKLRQKYMVRAGDEWEVEPAIKSMLQFRSCSLLDGVDELGHFDLVICPDILIYFYNGIRKRILDDIADALDPSGILIVGFNEAVTPFCKRFERVDHESGTFYRQLPDA